MNKHTSILVALIIVFSGSVVDLRAYPQFSKVTSFDVVRNLEATSQILAEAKMRLVRAETEYSDAKAIPNPRVHGSQETIDFPEGEETETAYGVSQDVSFLWESVPMIRSRAAALRAARARYQNELAEIQSEVLAGFARLRSLGSQRELADSTMIVLERLSEQAAARRIVGEASAFDLSRFNSETLQLRHNMIALSQDYWQVVSRLTELTGLSKEELLDVSVEEVPPPPFANVDDAVGYAKDHSPVLAASRSESQSAAHQVSANKWAMIPDVSVGAGRKEVSGGFNGPTVEIEVELPLFGQGRRFVKQATAEKRYAEISELANRERLEGDIAGIFDRLSLLNSDAARVVSPMEYLGQAVRLYDEGEISTLEMVDALRSVMDSQESLDAMASERLEVILRLYRLCGKQIVSSE